MGRVLLGYLLQLLQRHLLLQLLPRLLGQLQKALLLLLSCTR